MPLIGAAVVPHSPVLVPAIAGHHQAALRLTRDALTQVAQEFHARKIDLVVFLTPHGPEIHKAITINVCEQFHGSLLQFGDRQTSLPISGSPAAFQELKEIAEIDDVDLHVVSEDKLDYGTVVPGVSILPFLSHVSLVPITVSAHAWNALPSLASVLQEFGHRTKRRVGLVASADLLRRPKPQPKMLPLERTIGAALSHVDPADLANCDPTLCCGLPPILALLQTLHRQARHGTVLQFEAPLGVGQMTAIFDLR